MITIGSMVTCALGTQCTGFFCYSVFCLTLLNIITFWSNKKAVCNHTYAGHILENNDMCAIFQKKGKKRTKKVFKKGKKEHIN